MVSYYIQKKLLLNAEDFSTKIHKKHKNWDKISDRI